ncbi:MAG: hypothetical protein II927_07315, partial [Paludibacteraceae bacterium]|nr:hypothetical protein [Paludibacteraceae bacterium]
VTDDNDLMIINKSALTIRIAVASLRVMGRATQGVKLINLGKRNQNDEIASVCVVDHEEDAENEGVVEDTENNTTTENNNE